MSHGTAHARVAPRQGTRRASLAPLRVVPTAIQQGGNGLFAVLCMVLLGSGLVALLMLNTALAQGSFRLHDLQAQTGRLADTEASLTQAIDRQRAPGALAARASALGMVPATSMAFIRLRDGAIIGVADPAKADQALNVVTTPVAPRPVPPSPAPPAAPTPAPTTPAPTTTAPAATTPKPTAAAAPPAGRPQTPGPTTPSAPPVPPAPAATRAPAATTATIPTAPAPAPPASTQAAPAPSSRPTTPATPTPTPTR